MENQLATVPRSLENRNTRLVKDLNELFAALALHHYQGMLRKEVLTDIELAKLCRALNPNCLGKPVESVEFSRWFDFNGRRNLYCLAEIRKVTLSRLLLDLGVEVGAISEAKYRRMLRELESDDSVRSSVFINYSAGELKVNGEVVGKFQIRKSPTAEQQVLQKFQESNWPSEIDVPDGFDPQKTKNTIRRLREKKLGKLSFSETRSGTAIRFEVLENSRKGRSKRSNTKPTPK